jgi:geranylgeranyl reductase family protein
VQENFDVAVIGAGPAGSCASLLSCLNGAETALIEEKSVIGVPVNCGEFIPSLKDVKNLLPHSRNVEKVYALIPQEAVSNRTKLIRFYSPDNKCFEFKFDGLVLKRNLLEQAITEEAEKNGVKVFASSAARGLRARDNVSEILVKGPREEIVLRARLIIGADGFPSNVAKWARMESGYGPDDVALTLQNKMSDVEAAEDYVEMYAGNRYAPGGFAWIIPKGENEANVGLGVRLSNLLRAGSLSLRSYFETFLKKHPIASRKFLKARRLSLSAKKVPVGGRAKNIFKNNILLAGDAAGLVIAINGSGIPTAMISGCIAGEIAAKHLRGVCELSLYEKRLEEEIGAILRVGVAYRRVADKLMRSDAVFSAVLRMIGNSGVARVLKCDTSFPAPFL